MSTLKFFQFNLLQVEKSSFDSRTSSSASYAENEWKSSGLARTAKMTSWKIYVAGTAGSVQLTGYNLGDNFFLKRRIAAETERAGCSWR